MSSRGNSTSNLWGQIEGLQRTIRNAESRTIFELEKAKTELHQQEKELQECREQILRTVGTFQVNDKWISDELVTIHHSIDNWLSGLPEIDDFDRSWNYIHSHLMKKTLARRLKINPRLEGQASLAEMEVMKHDIFYVLWKTLLQPTLVGATDDQRSLFDQLLSQMVLLKPPKDSKAINVWRSDTYRALTETQQYKEQLDKCCFETAKTVQRYVQTFLFSGKVEWESKFSSFFDHVLKPTVMLATKLNCSTENYTWSWTGSLHTRVKFSDFQEFDFIDCKTHCSASKTKMNGILNGSMVGQFILLIFPGLSRQEEMGKVTIQKPVMLVAFEDPFYSLNPTLKSPSPYQPRPANSSPRTEGSIPKELTPPVEKPHKWMALFKP